MVRVIQIYQKIPTFLVINVLCDLDFDDLLSSPDAGTTFQLTTLQLGMMLISTS